MKKAFTTLFAATMAVSMSAAVTPHFGVEFGYDHQDRFCRTNIPSDVDEDAKAGKVKNESLDGFHFGGNVQLDFMEGQHIPSLVVGLNYEFLGTNHWDENSKDVKEAKKEAIDKIKAAGGKNISYQNYLSVHTLQIPIRGQYTYDFMNDWRIFAYTGPQLRMHVAERMDGKLTYKMDGVQQGHALTYDAISGKGTYTQWVDGKKTKEKEDQTEKDWREPWFDMSWGFGVGFAWDVISFNISYDLGMCNMITKAEKDNLKEINDVLNKNYKYKLNDNVLALTIGVRLK